jgi:DNA polymerase-3 subunit delta'
MITQLQFKPFEAPQKICIIKDVENLTPEAANSLLKTLEEPTKQSLLILTTGCPEKILETIRSRCHRVYFGGLTSRKLADQLTKDYAIDAEKAHVLAFFAEGYRSRAERLTGDQFFVFKNEAIDQILSNRNADHYLKGVLADKQRTKETLQVLFTWFRDLLLLKAGVDSSGLVHVDRLPLLQKQEARYSFQRIDEILGEIVKTKRLLEENLNIKISLSLLKEKLWRG